MFNSDESGLGIKIRKIHWKFWMYPLYTTKTCIFEQVWPNCATFKMSVFKLKSGIQDQSGSLSSLLLLAQSHTFCWKYHCNDNQCKQINMGFSAGPTWGGGGEALPPWTCFMGLKVSFHVNPGGEIWDSHRMFHRPYHLIAHPSLHPQHNEPCCWMLLLKCWAQPGRGADYSLD